MARKELKSQVDFTGGELMPEAKRRDDVAQIHAGARRLKNFRSLAIGGAVQRPGRRAIIYPTGTRNEYLRVSSSVEVIVCFSAGAVTLTDLAGNVIASNTSASYLWTATTLASISWCLAGAQIVMCYPGMKPQLAVYTRATNTWAFQAFAFRVLNNAVQMPLWRVSAPGATMTPSALTGAITMTCSASYFASSMIGRVLSILGQQVTITSVTSPTVASATVRASLCPSVVFGLSGVTTTAADMSGSYPVGSLATDGTNRVEVGTYSGAPNNTSIPGTLMGLGGGFYSSATGKTLVGTQAQYPVGSLGTSATPQPTVQWQEDFMGDVAGWPAACFYDRGRLGFCDFPQAQEAVLWSAVGSPDIFWIDATAVATTGAAGADANAAILELVPGKPRVRNVAGWGDQFVFTDRGIFQVPVAATNPLKPGSVEFRQISTDGVSGIRPVVTELALLYVNAGTNRVSAINATGSLTRPYVSNDLSDAHAHLFTGPISFTIATGDGKHPERYVYLNNADGSVVVGKFTADKQFVGWAPWLSADSVKWLSAGGANVYYSTSTGGRSVVQIEDDTQFLDCSIPVNAVPAGLVVAGKGPCLPFASGTVSLMDGLRDLGDRSVDANGNIIPFAGEDLSSATLMAGSAFTLICEPFAFQASAGADAGQRQRRRKIARAIVSVIDSSGFVWGDKEITAYNYGDDTTQAPPLREKTYKASPLGRDFDPRIALTKTRPGPLTILEIALEVTV